jgi:hypothetical protein
VFCYPGWCCEVMWNDMVNSSDVLDECKCQVPGNIIPLYSPIDPTRDLFWLLVNGIYGQDCIFRCQNANHDHTFVYHWETSSLKFAAQPSDKLCFLYLELNFRHFLRHFSLDQTSIKLWTKLWTFIECSL